MQPDEYLIFMLGWDMAEFKEACIKMKHVEPLQYVLDHIIKAKVPPDSPQWLIARLRMAQPWLEQIINEKRFQLAHPPQKPARTIEMEERQKIRAYRHRNSITKEDIEKLIISTNGTISDMAKALNVIRDVVSHRIKHFGLTDMLERARAGEFKQKPKTPPRPPSAVDTKLKRGIVIESDTVSDDVDVVNSPDGGVRDE